MSSRLGSAVSSTSFTTADMLADRKLAVSRSRRATGALIRGVIFTFVFISTLRASFLRRPLVSVPPRRLYTIYTVMQITMR